MYNQRIFYGEFNDTNLMFIDIGVFYIDLFEVREI